MKTAVTDKNGKGTYPIGCGIVIINPKMSMLNILDVLQWLYLIEKSFVILLPSRYLFIEEFSMLFMHHSIKVIFLFLFLLFL